MLGSIMRYESTCEDEDGLLNDAEVKELSNVVDQMAADFKKT